MKNSNIEWTDHTWNIATGCHKVNKDCKFCYMYRESLSETRYNPNVVKKTKTTFDLPLKIKQPSRIFTCSLTDFFHSEIDSFRNEAWEIIKKCPHHTFQILTKRPERIKECLPADWGKGYPNVHLGISCGHQEALNAFFPVFLKVPAQHRFLSLEPLIEEITFFHAGLKDTAWFINYSDDGEGGYFKDAEIEMEIDYVIIGGESGNDNGKYTFRECKLEWIENLLFELKNAQIPVFIKQLGTHLSKQLNISRHGKKMEEWPQHLQVRQFRKL